MIAMTLPVHRSLAALRNARHLEITGLLCLSLLVSATVFASGQQFDSGARQVTLLELFTSQGCSSCPPAERWLNDYVDDAGLWTEVVPVAFHVDYWDYLGWTDSLAAVAHGERQRDYARAGRTRSVYTPGMFANGREWRGWTLGPGPRASNREPGNLAVTIAGNQLSAAFPAADRTLELHVAILGFGIETRIGRGENRNRILQQEFVVLAHDSGTATDGRWMLPLPTVASGQASRYGIAVWVSEPGMPAPLQATGSWLDAPVVKE